jgi:twitching motility protein PilT
MDITDLLLATQKNNASDLHLSVGNPPIMRVSGDIVVLKMSVLGADEIRQMLYSIMTEQQRADYERDFEIDFALSFSKQMRFRVNAFNTIAGPAAVLRTIPTRIVTLEELNAPEIFKKLTELHKGLILVTGPTGSGKSTTLAAIINHINENYSKHILTIEDPVEFVHQSKKSLVNQREVGASTKSFAKALRSALREDPDVILVGELRDLETIQLAMTAAETGHLVMGTLHTNSAPKTIDRIIDVFPANDKEMVRAMLSVSVEAIITQALVKRADGTGRVAIHEILLGSPAIRNLIRENKIPQIASMMQVGSRMGMRTMKDAAYAMFDEGIITQETARSLLATSASDDAEPAKRSPSEEKKHDTNARSGKFGGTF